MATKVKSAPEPADHAATSEALSGDASIGLNEPAVDLRQRDPGRYEIIIEHGRGGLGKVSRARDQELGREVAIKELITRTPDSEQRFLREALITARLEHPNIVPIHEAGRWPDGSPYYSMKLVSGRSLKALIASCPSINQRVQLLDHVIAVVDAIAYAHKCGIVHRDLKPGNVVVGDFGETLVIDWGLAKDLSISEGELPPKHWETVIRSDLTRTGAVLGTPAYMAPEQERGEPVDERADVFAIGAMLWELCSDYRVPPTDPRHRDRILRRAGIDRDLAVIIAKALAPSKHDRYRDATALASDLKAFKAGMRVAARRYSFTAMIGRWLRKHWRIAIPGVSALALAIVGGIVHVRDIAVERDRADVALTAAEAQRSEAVRARDELSLQHARLLLRSDPSAAADLLATYHGSDRDAAALIQAQARSLGVAEVKGFPHSGRVLFTHGLPDRSLLSIGSRTVVKTDLQGRNRVVVSNVTAQQEAAYAESRHLLAYACEAKGICLLDAASEASRPASPDMAHYSPSSMDFSPNGEMLAAVSLDGRLAIWRVPSDGPPVLRYYARQEAGRAIRFLDNDKVVATTANNLRIFQLDTNHSTLTLRRSVDVRDVVDFSVSFESAKLAIATRAGELRLVALDKDISKSQRLCAAALNGVDFLKDGTHLGYACQDGQAGVWDISIGASTVTTQVNSGASMVTASANGRYLLIGGNSGAVVVYDFNTKLFSTYLGHTSWISYLMPPTDEFPYIASGDANGAMRIWPLPRADIRVAIQSSSRLISTAFASNTGPLVATQAAAGLRWASFDGKSGVWPDHYGGHMAISPSRDGSHLAVYMGDGAIELWSVGSKPEREVVQTGHGTVTAVRFRSDGRAFITAGLDGKILVWSVDSLTPREITHLPEPVQSVAFIADTDNLIIEGSSHRLWVLNGDSLRAVARETKLVHRWAISQDGDHLATVTEQGYVRLYDTRTWIVRASSSLDLKAISITLSIDGRKLMIADDKVVQIAEISYTLSDGPHLASDPYRLDWQSLDLRVEAVIHSSDGHWIAMLSKDGALWFYSIAEKRWICENVGSHAYVYGRFSPDCRHFAAADTNGRVLIVDMSLVRFVH